MDQTKLRILSAAAMLFDQKGYHGTSVRQIAEQADVNVALISYHFHGKQGVLERLISYYFETLFRQLKELEERVKACPPMEKLVAVIRLYLGFQRENAAITRLIQRELSVESILAREVMTLYISRWKHGIAQPIEEGIAAGLFRPVSVDHLLLITASQLIYPFMHPQSVRDVFGQEPASPAFVDWLASEIIRSLQSRLCLPYNQER